MTVTVVKSYLPFESLASLSGAQGGKAFPTGHTPVFYFHFVTFFYHKEKYYETI